MSKKFEHGTEINEGHYIELMDRLHVQISTIDEHIKDHPIACYYDGVYVLIEDALDKLNEAYQMVGSIEHDQVYKG